MATKLDRNFVQATLDNVRALANEVERLECYCHELETRLSENGVIEASSEAAKQWQKMPKILLE